jgi:hypothetical protein
MGSRGEMRYAMPVDPRILEKDFESSSNLDSKIENVLELLKLPEEEHIKESINNILSDLWFSINKKQGVNLRDREKLLPVFEELEKVYGNKSRYMLAHRGVRAPRIDPNFISETYPYLEGVLKNPKEPRVVNQLKSLAYGLRSWTSNIDEAMEWSSGQRDPSKVLGRDIIIFEIVKPDIILDATPVLRNFMGFNKVMFDIDELIIFVKNPTILSIVEKNDSMEFGDELFYYLVRIKDN